MGVEGLLHTRYEAPAGSCGDRCTLICLFLFIPFVPLRPLQVSEGKIFALNSRVVFSPTVFQHAGTSHPELLPSPFLPLTPSFPPASASLLQQLSLCKANGKVTRENGKRVASPGWKVDACNCSHSRNGAKDHHYSV